MEGEKEVLVGIGERKRPVTFQSSSDPSKEKESLLMAIKDVFKEVLTDKDEERLILQVKSDRWNGEFVELHGDMVVDNHSIVQLSVDAQSGAHEVSMISRVDAIINVACSCLVWAPDPLYIACAIPA